MAALLHAVNEKSRYVMFYAIRKAFSFVCLASLIAGVNACTAEQEIEQGVGIEGANTAQVFADSEGILHFASHETFFQTIEAIGNMSEADLNAWEQGLGFESYRRSFENVMLRVVTAKSAAEADAILSENSDIVEINGDEANPRIRALGYSAVIDRQGVFFVAGVIHKVLPEFVISAEDGQIETINDAMTKVGELGLRLVVSMSNPLPGVRVVRYAGDSLAQLESSNLGCTDNKTAWFNTSDRKVDFQIRTWKYYCATCCGNYYYQVLADANLKGYKKILGMWSSYSTAYECQNIEAVITAPKVLGFNGTNSVFIYEPVTVQQTAWKGSGTDYQSWTCASWLVGGQVQNSNINEPYLEKVKGQGKSRGTGTGNWAEICCGYVGGCSFPAQCVPRLSCYAGECGSVSNGCGGYLNCGSCSTYQCPGNYDDCGGGECCPAGKACGSSTCILL